jgi:hypothetical protein
VCVCVCECVCVCACVCVYVCTPCVFGACCDLYCERQVCLRDAVSRAGGHDSVDDGDRKMDPACRLDELVSPKNVKGINVLLEDSSKSVPMEFEVSSSGTLICSTSLRPIGNLTMFLADICTRCSRIAVLQNIRCLFAGCGSGSGSGSSHS